MQQTDTVSTADSAAREFSQLYDKDGLLAISDEQQPTIKKDSEQTTRSAISDGGVCLAV